MRHKIDAHLHVAKVLAGYCRRGELRAVGGGKAAWANGEVFQLLPTEGGYGDDHFYAEEAMKIMDRNNVERAVLMNGSMYGFQNLYHEEILAKYPERFCPSCTVDPFMTNYMELMERFFGEKHFHLAKFEVSSGGGLMGCHEPFDLAGERMMPIYRLIEQYHGVVALDIGDLTMESHQPTSIARIAMRCPDLQITVCHLMAPIREYKEQWKAELELLKSPNINFDFSALPKIMAPDRYPYPETVEYLAEAKDIVGADHLMWGTDAPFAATLDTYEHLADYLEQSKAFTDEELEAMYYGNAKRIYFSEG